MRKIEFCEKAVLLASLIEILYTDFMARELNHLNALLALEASARLGSFTRAAAELNVTPAAVGQQVRILEEYLGRKIFHRSSQGLQVTPAAVAALTDLEAGFDRLEAGFRQLGRTAAGRNEG